MRNTIVLFFSLFAVILVNISCNEADVEESVKLDPFELCLHLFDECEDLFFDGKQSQCESHLETLERCRQKCVYRERNCDNLNQCLFASASNSEIVQEYCGFNGEDGDVVIDGDTPLPDGDKSDGDTVDGDLAEDGDIVTDGDTATDGDANTDGDIVDGDDVDGDSTTDGDSADGDSVDGDTTVDGDVEPVCSGSCDEASFCIDSDLCYCTLGQYSLMDCQQYCQLAGMNSLGCSDSQCICDESSIDGDTDTEIIPSYTAKFCDALGNSMFQEYCIEIGDTILRTEYLSCGECAEVAVLQERDIVVTNCAGFELGSGELDQRPVDNGEYIFTLVPDDGLGTLTVIDLAEFEQSCEETTYEDLLDILD